MLNIIGFLLILIITMLRIKSGYESNPLLDMGMLLLTGYIFSVLMKYFRLPAVFGYILAGVMAGNKGLGFLSEKFVKDMTFVENIFLMLVISITVKHLIHTHTLKNFIKNFSAGALTASAVFILTTGFIAPLPFPVTQKIMFGLFASILSPLILYSCMDENTFDESSLQTAFGGLVTTILIWGIASAAAVTQYPGRIRLAFMPVIVGLTSFVAGFIWAYVADKLIYRFSENVRSLYPVAVLFLIYPLINIFGLDILFLAAGIGLYNGLISERETSLIEKSQIPLIIVFAFFGTRLSLEKLFIIEKPELLLAVRITIILLFAKITMLMVARWILSLPRMNLWNISLFIPFGPLSIIVLGRFMPYYYEALTGDMNTSTVYSICMISILLTIVISFITSVLFRLLTRRNVSS